MAGGNLRCEHHLRQHKSTKELRLRTTCAVHRCHTAQTHQLSLVSRVVSGLLRVALTMKVGGSLQALRRAMDIYLQSRLVVRQGLHPPGPDSSQSIYREAVLKLFLGVSHGVAGACRAFTLRKYLNGDRQVSGKVQHFCVGTCCASGPDRKELREQVVQALLPAVMPKLVRNRWVGTDGAIDFGGLAFSIGSMMTEIVPSWIRELGNPGKPVGACDFEADWEDPDADMLAQGFQTLTDGYGEEDGEDGCFLPNSAVPVSSHPPTAPDLLVHPTPSCFFVAVIGMGRMCVRVSKVIVSCLS